MLKENNSHSLLDKMDAMDRLPGEAPFNKGAAWDRLQQRMKVEAPVKRRMWYWWVAAAVLIAFMIPFLLREKTIPVLSPVQDVVHTPFVSPVPSVAVKTAKVIAPLEVQPSSHKKGIIGQTDTLAQIPDVAITSASVVTIAVKDDSSLAATVTPATDASARKMRVVHINDIGGDVIGNTYVYPDHKQFKLAVGGRAGFASQIVSDKPSNNIPKN